MNEQNGQPSGNNKTYVYIAAIIVVLILAAWAIYAFTHQGNDVSDNNQPAAVQNNLNNSTDTTSTPAGSGKKLSYGDAIKAYPYRFQFKLCQGTPASMAVKKGSVVMLDNRDATAHTFKADTQTFKIAGYDYVVLNTEVVGNLAVTCDGKNRVTLNVEK